MITLILYKCNPINQDIKYFIFFTNKYHHDAIFDMVAIIEAILARLFASRKTSQIVIIMKRIKKFQIL